MDLERLQQIADMMDRSDLSEIDVKRGGFRVRMMKEALSSASAAHPDENAPKAPVKKTKGSPAKGLSQGLADAIATKMESTTGGQSCTFVVSPRVGIFRGAKKKDGSVWAAGDAVAVGDRVGVVEVMKIPHDIVSKVEGMLYEFLVEEGEGVEYGQPVVAIQEAADV